MKRARTGYGVALFNGRIHLVGGFCDNVDDNTSVEIYDPETNSWSEVSSISSFHIFQPSLPSPVFFCKIVKCNWFSISES